ncbi:MAG: GntR family transcriptional regulator [Lachnospiraceae bacterium]|nr:GntR family transcriptional regulator [Lachnospiraceae bacterium]MBQ4300096.1 GntR family transcriptional regulator [Lachnospiraceae bacterium]
MVWIDVNDSTPIYEQIVNQFKNLIASGVLTTDEKIPSVRNLAMELSINPNTIQKAYAELERQGYIYTVKGRGNFVCQAEKLAKLKTQEVLDHLEAVAQEAEKSGMEIKQLIDYLESR